MEKKNPLLVGLIGIIPAAVKTISSIVKDKKPGAAEVLTSAEETTLGGQIVGGIKDAVSGSISSKRVINLGGTAAITSFAISDMVQNGINLSNFSVLALGAAFCVAMTFVTAWSERVK